jgi:hypothetical protein
MSNGKGKREAKNCRSRRLGEAAASLKSLGVKV